MVQRMGTPRHGLGIKIDPERFIKAVRDLSKPHGQIELHELLFAQPLFQPVHERFRGAGGSRKFLSGLEDEFLQIIVDRTRCVVRQLIDLLVGQASP